MFSFIKTLVLVAILPALALAKGNHFAGLTVANANGGVGSYTCRSAAQVLTLPNLYTAPRLPSNVFAPLL